MQYHLILHNGLRADIDALDEARKRDPQSDAAKAYVAAIKALKALQDGREGERLGRKRGLLEPGLQGVGEGERPSVGPQREGVPTTPVRGLVPADLLKQAQILRDSPRAGTAPRPPAAPQANVNRPSGPGSATSKER